MHICATHGCHTSHAHAGFCPDCMAVHAAGLSISVPTVLAVALGAALLVYAATRFARLVRAPRVATA
ncbi:MAG: hypothetical protein KIT54_11755 [Phycisphaeraceae bacterium]|nr:hypothetical protein [Phycisphaeraceae bacterium]